MNKLLINFYNNLSTNTEFYKFNRINDIDNRCFYYDGKELRYKYGTGFPVVNANSEPYTIFDIAYKNGDKLYQILTDKEVVLAKRGYNSFDMDVIVAAEVIYRADSVDLKEFEFYMTQKKNLNYYENIFIKCKREKVKPSKKLLNIKDVWLD